MSGMIWYMSTRDLMHEYSKRPIEKLEKTNYLIMSSCVRITKERDNVLNISQLFMNAGLLKGVRFDIEPDSITAREQFKNFLLKNVKAMGLLCSLIECTLLEDEDTVIICTPKEMNCKYLELFSEVVEEIFDFPILRYPDICSYDLESVLKRLLYYKKELKEVSLSSTNGSDRVKILNSMSKKELKKRLKKRGLYSSTMSKSEMIEVLTEYY